MALEINEFKELQFFKLSEEIQTSYNILYCSSVPFISKSFCLQEFTVRDQSGFMVRFLPLKNSFHDISEETIITILSLFI